MPDKAEKIGTVGLIAGGGALPFIIAEQAAMLGRKVVAAGLKGFVKTELKSHVEQFSLFGPGNLKACIEFLKKSGSQEIVFCGQIDHRVIFADKDFDELMRSILAKADNRADSLLSRIAEAVEEHGLRVARLRDYLGEHLAPEGILGTHRPNKDALRDLEFGWKLAEESAELNIGQSLMVKAGVVIAVEAMEGTDAMIRRGGELAGPGATVIKLPLKDKDPRFDLPVVGSSTIKTMAAMGAVVLAFAAGETIIIDPQPFRQLADETGISVVSRRLERVVPK
jgi:DUF1009 family protein